MKFLRKLLGTDSIEKELQAVRNELASTAARLHGLTIKTAAIGTGVGRIIAKIDPVYGQDELDPARMTESDRIGKQIIEKLTGEFIASGGTGL